VEVCANCATGGGTWFAALSGLEEYLCLFASIIAPLFPNLHTVVGVFNSLLGDPFIADFIVGFRWCKPCVKVAGSGGGGAGWIMQSFPRELHL